MLVRFGWMVAKGNIAKRCNACTSLTDVRANMHRTYATINWGCGCDCDGKEGNEGRLRTAPYRLKGDHHHHHHHPPGNLWLASRTLRASVLAGMEVGTEQLHCRRLRRRRDVGTLHRCSAYPQVASRWTEGVAWTGEAGAGRPTVHTAPIATLLSSETTADIVAASHCRTVALMVAHRETVCRAETEV